jgi:membrane-anchored glycerophosphoryl diester phosphodiesterase (GDPDase)
MTFICSEEIIQKTCLKYPTVRSLIGNQFILEMNAAAALTLSSLMIVSIIVRRRKKEKMVSQNGIRNEDSKSIWKIFSIFF